MNLVQGNEDKKLIPKGWKRNRSIITGSKVQFKKVKQLIDGGGDLNLSSFSLSRGEEYKAIRRTQTVRKVVNSQTRQDNAAESMRGITITPYGLGLVRYSWVKTPDIALLRTELNLRSVNFVPTLNITGLRDLIKKDENNRHDPTGKSFKPVDISMYAHVLVS